MGIVTFFVDNAILLTQLLLAAAAIWYSYETRTLRIQNLEEIRLLANQGRLALAPFLVPGVQKLGINELVQMVEDDQDLTQGEKERRSELLKKEEVFFAVVVDNPTADKTACHLEPYIYDPGTKSFLTPDHGKEWISPKGKELFQVTGPYVTQSGVAAEVTKSYGDIALPLLHHLDSPTDHGYVALFFQDIEGTLYLAKRQFVQRDGKMNHNSPTKLYSAAIRAG